jgi:hypothetical protein
VTPEDVASELDVLASRVRRISPPLASNPNRFHEERSDIARDLADLARRVSPSGQTNVSRHSRRQRYSPRAHRQRQPDSQGSAHRGAETRFICCLRR